jgi:hypothetical protein
VVGISVGPIRVPGITPDAGPYTIIEPAGTSCAVDGLAPLSPMTGSTFTVTMSFTGAIVDECANSVLNGSGYTITPSSGTAFGIQVNTTSGVTVENAVVGGTPTEAIEVINSTTTVVTNATSATGMDYGVFGTNDVGLNVSDSHLNGTVEAGVGIRDSKEFSLYHTFACNGESGLLESLTTGSNVTDLNATGNAIGIYLSTDTNVALDHDNASGSSQAGIDQDETDQVLVTDFYAAKSTIGIAGLFSDQTTVTDANLSSEAEYGLQVAVDVGLNVSGSNLSRDMIDGASVLDSASVSFWADAVNRSTLDGFDIENSTQVVVGDSWATYDGWNGLRAVGTSELTTWSNVFDNVTAANGNGTELVVSSNSRLTGDRDSGDAYGVRDGGSTQLSVTGVNTSDDVHDGLAFTQDSGVTVSNASCLETAMCLVFTLSSDDAVVNYTADNATTVGILFEQSTEISASNSAVTGSAYGPSTFGIEVVDAYATTLVNDSMANFEIDLFADSAVDSTFDDLNATNASDAALVALGGSAMGVENGNFSTSAAGFDLLGVGATSIIGNTFYHDALDFAFQAGSILGVQVYWNNFINGPTHGWDVDLDGATGTNIVFADGYPGGGNYWSNWTGPDTKSGPQQNLPGGDGIVDDPLPIVGTLQDPYPLTHRVSISDTTAQFIATGLPTGATWSVTFNGTPQSTATNSLLFSTNTAAKNISFDYSVVAPGGWTASPATGAVLTDGSALVVMVAFTQVTYPVVFEQAGLATGTPWSVTVNGTTISSSSGSTATSLPNGTYSYSVTPVVGYTVAPASGMLTVASAGNTTALTFQPVEYPVDFTEHGLPAGTNWTVTFNGVPKSLPSATISFEIANGTYRYSVGNVSGYSLVGGSGSQVVAGPGASVQVAFTANSSFGTGSPLFWALVAAIAILAVALIAVLLIGRRKPPASANPWTPPPATGGAAASPTPPAAGSPPPPPGATGGAAPDWKE